jgi:hypothetical protein
VLAQTKAEKAAEIAKMETKITLVEGENNEKLSKLVTEQTEMKDE